MHFTVQFPTLPNPPFIQWTRDFNPIQQFESIKPLVEKLCHKRKTVPASGSFPAPVPSSMLRSPPFLLPVSCTKKQLKLARESKKTRYMFHKKINAASHMPRDMLHGAVSLLLWGFAEILGFFDNGNWAAFGIAHSSKLAARYTRVRTSQ